MATPKPLTYAEKAIIKSLLSKRFYERGDRESLPHLEQLFAKLIAVEARATSLNDQVALQEIIKAKSTWKMVYCNALQRYWHQIPWSD
jgi:hypothetical protein